jgi:hypothetical protein
MKNKFKDTVVGKFINEKAPHILNIIGDVLPDKGTLGIVKNIISNDPDLTPEEKQEIHARLVDFYKLEVEDRNSAREREVNIIEKGGTDWMMNATGIIGLGSFLILIFAIVFITVPESNSELLIHTTGIVEGIVLSIVGYYFGSVSQKRD